MSIERYPRYPFRKDVLLVDHISYCLNKQKESEYFYYVKENIPQTSGEFRKPHLTVAYSYTAIEDFPKLDYESSLELSLLDFKYPSVISARPDKYGIYIDPFQIKHLVLYVHSEALYAKFNYYLRKGATWLHDTYNPFLIIESHTDHNDSTILTLPTFAFPLDFDIIRYSRFGELPNWTPPIDTTPDILSLDDDIPI